MDLKVNGLQKEIGELDRGIARLLDAIERAPDFCLLSPLHHRMVEREGKTDPLVERLRERNLERERLRAELSSLQAQMEGPGAIPDVEELRNTLQGALEHGPSEEARAFLKTIVEAIVVDGQEAMLRYRFPLGPSDTSMTSAPTGALIIDVSVKWHR